MPRSLRSSSILASLLWTGGLLALMHMFFLAFTHAVPGIRGGHSVVVVIAGIGFMCAGVLELRHSLVPFRRLRQQLTTVRTGRERLVGGAYPTEVQPLIDELNALIEDREQAVRRAVAAAGDLAHGLKTPLALLAQEADQTAAEGNAGVAASIRQQVERMSRQINYHLARARAAAFCIFRRRALFRVYLCWRAVTNRREAIHRTRAHLRILRIPGPLGPRALGGPGRNVGKRSG